MPATEMDIDIKKTSPLDAVDALPNLIQIKKAAEPTHWVPSRYNVRTTGRDGSYIVWNTYSGAISIFKPAQRVAIQTLLRTGYTGKVNGVVKYLSERGFLIPEGTDEYRQFQLGFGQAHYRHDALELILFASEDCNFRCTYCYEDFPRGTMAPAVRSAIKQLVQKRATALRRLTIGWFGGEPLYGFAAIEDLGPFFVDIAEQYSINYSSHITTNGYLLTPSVAEKLLAWKVVNYQITLDGLADQHNQKRRARDGSPTFDAIFANLQSLKQRDEDFQVRIRVNYDLENYQQVENLLVLLQEEFACDARFGVAFHPIGKWGGSNDADLSICGAVQAREIKDSLSASAMEKGLPIKGTIRDMNALGKNVCYAARPYNFTIGSDGKVMKCTVALDKQAHNIVGTLTPEGELILDFENYARWVEPAFENDPVCRKCSLLPTCQGISCPLIRIQNRTQPCAATPKSRLRPELLFSIDTAKFKSKEIAVGPSV